MSSRNKATKLIKDRISRNRAFKNKQAKRRGPYGLVIDFIKIVEKIGETAQSATEYNNDLIRETGLLLERFKQIDPEIQLELKWNDIDNAKTWKDLQLEGVLITWSKFWRSKHPLEHESKYIDIADLMLKGVYFAKT